MQFKSSSQQQPSVDTESMMSYAFNYYFIDTFKISSDDPKNFEEYDQSQLNDLTLDLQCKVIHTEEHSIVHFTFSNESIELSMGKYGNKPDDNFILIDTTNK